MGNDSSSFLPAHRANFGWICGYLFPQTCPADQHRRAYAKPKCQVPGSSLSFSSLRASTSPIHVAASNSPSLSRDRTGFAWASDNVLHLCRVELLGANAHDCALGLVGCRLSTVTGMVSAIGTDQFEVSPSRLGELSLLGVRARGHAA